MVILEESSLNFSVGRHQSGHNLILVDKKLH